MARIHLFEFEDQKWFPSFLRNYGTDFLQFLSNKTKMYASIVPIIEKGLKASDENQIVDLASGGGGGFLWLNTELKKSVQDLRITLTDYYPNIAAFKRTQSKAANFDYSEQSVDARNVPKELKGLRTQFLSLHHFKPEDARLILENAVTSEQPIAIFEAQERSFAGILAMFFSPLSVIFTTPFIRPFKLGRLFFTYILPIVPLFVWWDGIVSSLRTYPVEEMENLVKSLPNGEQYNWEIGRSKPGAGAILYLLGTKK